MIESDVADATTDDAASKPSERACKTSVVVGQGRIVATFLGVQQKSYFCHDLVCSALSTLVLYQFALKTRIPFEIDHPRPPLFVRMIRRMSTPTWSFFL